MSILNRPNDGIFNVLIAVYSTILKLGPLTRGDIRNIVAPGVIEDDHVKNVLNRWIQLGLFVEDSAGIVSIKDSYMPPSDKIMHCLPSMLRTVLFKKDNNKDIWDDGGSADFTRGISWLLAQDVYSFASGSHAVVQETELKQLQGSGKKILQNDTRWQGLRHWVPFLGFGFEGKSLVIDPTVAVRESLPSVFSSKSTLTVSSFLESLAKSLPVIDSGGYRMDVEAELDPQVWSKPPKMYLSTSLSRALRRLELTGHIDLEYRADSGEAYKFLRHQGVEWGKACTHVTWYKREVR